MKTNFKYTLVVPFYYSEMNLKYIKSLIKGKPKEWEVLIVYSDATNKLEYIDLKANIKYIKSSQYNVGWLYNIGLKYSKSDNIVFCPLGVLFDYKFLSDCSVKDNVYFYNRKAISNIVGWDQNLSGKDMYSMQELKKEHNRISGEYKKVNIDAPTQKFDDFIPYENWESYRLKMLKEVASPYFIYKEKQSYE